jgi:hypothetical protein
MLLLDNFVARELNEIIFGQQIVEDCDEAPNVVEVGYVELLAVTLLNGEQVELRVVNQLYKLVTY